jgi:pimeloyl-ACP methyl ester carboxylesterase
VLASERDFWSRPGDRDKMKEDMVHAPIAKVVVIPNATHFVHLDRPECGRQLLLNAIVSFIHDK